MRWGFQAKARRPAARFGVLFSRQSAMAVFRGAVCFPNPAGVFAEGLVADVMQPVLNALMAPVVGQQPRGIGLVTRQRCDAVDDLGRPFLFTRFGVARDADAGDPEDLSHARPAELLLEEGVQRGRGFDGPVLAATVACIRLGVPPSFRLTLPLLVGGPCSYENRAASCAVNSCSIAFSSVG